MKNDHFVDYKTEKNNNNSKKKKYNKSSVENQDYLNGLYNSNSGWARPQVEQVKVVTWGMQS